MELFDFDKNLSEYAQAWYEEHEGRLTPDEMEDAMDKIYLDWLDTPIKEIGETPKMFFAHREDKKLYSDFLTYFENKSIPMALTDEITRHKTIVPYLEKTIRESTDGEMIQTIMPMLEEFGDRDIYSLYIQWIMDEDFDDEIAMHACEIMQVDANLVSAELEQRLEEATDKVRDRISDLLVYAKPTKIGFQLLVERFLQGKDLQLYATYLGMYGMEQAVPVLKSKALDCDYAAFVEITNAIERLGGEMDIKRDFSQDLAYQKIKGAQYVDANTGRHQE